MLTLNVSICVLLVTVFLILRKISWNMAQKDQDIGTANAYFSFPLENLPRIRQFESYWAWIKSIFVTNFETIEEICGKDSKIYLQFQLYCIIFLSVVTVVSLAVILPLNFSGLSRNIYENSS